MVRAIEAIVKGYLHVKDIRALEAMRAHRVGLLARSVDRDGYSFETIRTDLQEDLVAIDAGLQQLKLADAGQPDQMRDGDRNDSSLSLQD